VKAPELDTVICGDALEVMRSWPDGCVQTCVTSPPYWGLRDYGVEGQIGAEATLEEWVARMVEVFREVRRVLRDDGTLWLNLGDSYNVGTNAARRPSTSAEHGYWQHDHGDIRRAALGLKPKDLCGQPWTVALALRADGWYLRRDIIWVKPNPMPESAKDRPTTAHEYLFLLSKSPHYYYDADAIKEPVTGGAHARGDGINPKAQKQPRAQDGTGPRAGTGRFTAAPGRGRTPSFSGATNLLVSERNKRSVWTVATCPYPDAHFATFPPKLITPCIQAGAPEGGVVLDPFVGSGTTAMVAHALGRRYVGIELNPEYVAMAEKRLAQRSLLAELAP
jgi:DNA modification methylase